MKGKRTIRPEERALWRKVARSVTPLDDAKKQSLERDEEPPLVPPSRNIDDPSGDVSARKPDKPLPQRHAYRDPATHHPPVPHDRSTEKRVRRGRVEIDARLDLHGLTQDQALSSLRHFITMAHRGGYRTVLVIFAALPSAAAAHVLASVFGADREAVATLIAQTMFIGCFTLPVWLMVLG